MAVISLYNHKGGVSKTTTTFNLANCMVDRGAKVLLIDADPQCNMTEIALAPIIEEMDAAAEEAGGNEEVDELPGTSLLDALKPRIHGEVSFVEIESIETVEIRDGLDIIRGSVDLTSIEDELSEAHMQRFSNRPNLQKTYVALGDLVDRIGEEHGYDYVFMDVGPSSGALTRACFLACDGFFIPVAPDRFNVQAIGSLSRIIARWLREHGQVVEDYVRLELPIKHGKPVFLGAISQFFKVHKGRPKPGYKLWMNRIPVRIEKDLQPVLENHSSDTKELMFPDQEDEFIATEIPDFGSLAPLMQEMGKPVYAIAREDTARITRKGQPWGGGTWKDAEERMSKYRAKLDELAERLEAAFSPK